MNLSEIKHLLIRLLVKKPFIVEHWFELESPLIEIDMFLQGYCQRNGISIANNTHDWPSRRLDWTNNKIKRQLGLSLETDMKTYKICGSAYVDDDDFRWIKFITLKEGVIPPLSNAVFSEIDNWVLEINSILRSDLTKSVQLPHKK